MWIFTKDGYYSAVQHDDSPDTIQVRARIREDLVRLAEAVGLHPGQIIDTPLPADYGFRLNVDRGVFAAYVAKAVTGIDYVTDVKGHLSRDEPDRKSAMMDCWSAMAQFQDGRFPPTYAKGQQLVPEDLWWDDDELDRAIEMAAENDGVEIELPVIPLPSETGSD